MRTLVFLSLIALGNLQAQPYVEGGRTRHRFAQLNFGIDSRYIAPGRVLATPQQQGFALRSTAETRLLIGGTHFWGHADFFVAIPLLTYADPQFYSGPETGGRFYPWRIERQKLRPFAGASWQPTALRIGEGAFLYQHRFPLTAGATYQQGAFMMDLTVGYLPHAQLDYYLSPEENAPVNWPRFWAALAVKYSLDATLGAERNWRSGHTQRLTDTLARLGKLNGFTLALGPSSGLFLGHSEYNKIHAPHLHQHRAARVFMEWGVGYYLHRPDMQINLAWRQQGSTQKAYGHRQNLQRKALTLEVYKFLLDYHGFVPFAGAALSYDQLSLTERPGHGPVWRASRRDFFPGITFGWDIRPNRVQSWYLRTNLRWFPFQKLRHPHGGNVNFRQLEFNFIQLVVFPGRLF